MFEISIENRFEINENYLKMIKKVIKMGVWGGSGTEWGPGDDPEPQKANPSPPFWRSFWGQFGS